jgi:hypothetical protein
LGEPRLDQTPYKFKINKMKESFSFLSTFKKNIPFSPLVKITIYQKIVSLFQGPKEGLKNDL